MKIIDRFLRAIFVVSFLIVPTSFCLSMAQVGAESEVPNTLEGVWMAQEPNTPSYSEIDGLVSKTGLTYDFDILVNPAIEGDRVYRNVGDGTFFYRDQLVLATTPVYRILPGAKSFKEDPMGRSLPGKEDEYDWAQFRGGRLPYLWGTTLRVKDTRPDRVYLTDDEFGGGENWSHFFYREQLVLLNPSCLPEKIPEGKLK